MSGGRCFVVKLDSASLIIICSVFNLRDLSNLQMILKGVGVAEKPAMAIGGLQNGGLHFAKLASKAGFRIVAVADEYSGIVDLGGNGGLKVPDLVEFRKLGKDFRELVYENTRKTKPEFLMKMEVDILVPEVSRGIINDLNALDVRAKVIIQTSRGLITRTAARILEQKMIPVIALY